MSLLMDALKRAEASKQQASRGETPAATEPTPAELAGLSLEPIGSGENEVRGNSLPDLASHLDAVDADLAASANETKLPPKPVTPAAPSAAPGFVTADPGREAARAMFAAKSAPPPSRIGLWLAVSALGVCALGIAIYFWLQLNHLNGNSLGTQTQAVRAIPPPAAPIPLTQTAPVPVPEPAQQATPPAPSGDGQGPLAERASATRETMRDRQAVETQAAAEPTLGNSRMQLTRSRPVADPNILRAWRSMQAGMFEAARKDYELGLKADPKNIDALMGLAVIASRQGRQSDAERYYQLALEADPKDAAAQAAMIGLSAPSDPSTAESRLKSALSAQPESASLNFALGNLYAREQRWNEAQQAYFNAVTGENDNPDYLFNLAVSLDQLRQAKLSSQYYRQALDAAEKRPAAFDRERIRQRLGQLTPP